MESPVPKVTAQREPRALRSGLRSTRRGRAALAASALLLSCGMGMAVNPGAPAGDVVVYEALDFDDSVDGFRATGGAEIELTADAVAGQALLVRPRRAWGGARLQLEVEGSEGLKLALLAKGANYPSVELNVFDGVADDNTTSEAPRFIGPDHWAPVLYSLDRFVYNSRRRTTVGASTFYEVLRFFGPSPPAANSWMIVDNLVLYRGTDSTEPEPVSGLAASPAGDGLRLAWSPARDNVGAMGYVVSRRRSGEKAFTKVAEVVAAGWRDPAPGRGLVEYRVLAFDFERNLGPWSETLSVRSSVGDAARSPLPASANPLDRESLREIHARGRGRVRKGHVCLFGDSLTHARVYRGVSESALGVYTVAAHGFESARTDHGPRQIGTVLAQENPEYLLVLLGTNNLRSGLVPTQSQLSRWMSDLEAVVNEAHERGTVVLLGTVPPRGFDDPQSRPEATYNLALHRLGARIGVPVAPIFERLQEAGERRKYLAEDGLHWRTDAMKLAARAWADTLRQVEWHLRDR